MVSGSAIFPSRTHFQGMSRWADTGILATGACDGTAESITAAGDARGKEKVMMCCGEKEFQGIGESFRRRQDFIPAIAEKPLPAAIDLKLFSRWYDKERNHHPEGRRSS